MAVSEVWLKMTKKHQEILRNYNRSKSGQFNLAHKNVRKMWQKNAKLFLSEVCRISTDFF